MRLRWNDLDAVAMYDDSSPSNMRALYFRFWGLRSVNWQIGVQRRERCTCWVEGATPRPRLVNPACRRHGKRR